MNVKKRKVPNHSDSRDRLVYSTDPIPEKPASPMQKPSTTILKPAVAIERKGRGGKTVTIVSRLPRHETWLKELCSHLKRKLGSGGTYSVAGNEGVVEIQGDHRAQILSLVKEFATSSGKMTGPPSR